MSEPSVQILGPDGKALAPQRSRVSALSGGGGTPYDAADTYNEHLAGWRPFLWSPDAEINIFRDRIVSRVRDLVRNDGWASAGVTRILDNAVGANFRPIAKPDYRALAAYTGNKAFDATWADEFGRAAEAHYRMWANDPGHYCDLGRRLTMAQMMRLAFRHKLIDGDGLGILHWRPERIGLGRGSYATTLQLIDPDRLSNPQLAFDTQTRRGGVEIDEDGVAIGYWVRKAHQGDWWSAGQSMTWEFVPRETRTGRPIVVHDYDHERADQHRGGVGIFAPVLARMKMLAHYDRVELDAAVVNSIFGAYIESPYDPSLVQDALGDSAELGAYQQMRADFHADKRLELGGTRVPILMPGEKMNFQAAQRPSSNFEEFENTFLRNFAAATGLSAQQLSNNWSDVNYSSARGALLEAWKTLSRRRVDFGVGFCTPIYSAFLEEVMEYGELPLPNDAPSFLECRAAYSACKWMGPGRGWIDPVDERAGAILGLDACLSTLEQEAAENVGEDYEEILDQRAAEIKACQARGIPLPTWANAAAAQAAAGPKDANETKTTPTPQ